MILTAVEARILGSLMEKETTTPEVYPLSLNALVAACNQKSSREPLLQLTEREIAGALRSLEDAALVTVDHGSRVERYENRARTVFSLRRDEAALLCLLLLRGAQTPGELRGRADRLFAFDDVGAVLSALERMATVPDTAPARDILVTALPRSPGSREQRYVTRLCALPEAALPIDGDEAMQTQPLVSGSTKSASDAEIAHLAAQLLQLQQRVTALEQALAQAEILPR